MQKLGWLILACALAAPALACENLARTELEVVFCKVKAQNPQALPYSLGDFRKNPAKTQRLLLTRPAQKAGIALPPQALAKPEPKPGPVSVPKSSANPVAETKVAPSAIIDEQGENRLQGCSLSGTNILCDGIRYRLQANKPNSQLPKSAFKLTLELPEYQGSAGDSVAEKTYIANCYRVYIDRMVQLGLAANTMSYTKFHYTYLQIKELGANFTDRMATMFEYLKRDKANIAVQQSYTDKMPKSLDQCSYLNDFILTCDDVVTNWVYQRD